MIPYIDNELKQLKAIDRDVKANWLDILNTELTKTQGKAEPHKIFDNKTYLSKLVSFLGNKAKRGTVHKELHRIDEPGWLDEYYASCFQIWAWSLNKVVHKIPTNVWSHLNDEIDFDKVPTEPLFRLPQWSTMVDIDIAGVVPRDTNMNIRLLLAGILTINGKEYLNVRSYATPRAEKEPNYWSTVSFGFYIARDSKTLQEGIEKAEREIAECKDSEHNHFRWVKLADNKDTINDFLNIVMFITSEHSKSAMGKSEVKWEPKAQVLGLGYKIKPRALPVTFVVGAEYDLSKFKGGSGGIRASHFRKGHFRTYWTGPRDGTPRGTITHWIPPMVIKGTME